MKYHKILYVFRKPVQKNLSQITLNTMPEDAFYGLTHTRKSFTILLSDNAHNSKIINGAQYVLNKIILQFVDTIGFSLIPTFFLLLKIRKADLIFTTADTYGLPIAFFKKLGVIKKPLVYNTIGLYDGLMRKKNTPFRYFYRYILSSVDHFLSSGSMQECEKLGKLLCIPHERFSFIPFGIDTFFFHPKNINESNEIVTIGVDPSRDWDLFFSVARNLPEQQFRLITNKDYFHDDIPHNVTIEYNLSFIELRRRIWMAKCIVLLTKTNHYFSGQSTMFRCMACSKSVIITDSPSIKEYDLKSGLNCVIVPEGNISAVINAINSLSSLKKREIIGKKARHFIVSNANINQYGQKLTSLFVKVLQDNIV